MSAPVIVAFHMGKAFGVPVAVPFGMTAAGTAAAFVAPTLAAAAGVSVAVSATVATAVAAPITPAVAPFGKRGVVVELNTAVDNDGTAQKSSDDGGCGGGAQRAT